MFVCDWRSAAASLAALLLAATVLAAQPTGEKLMIQAADAARGSRLYTGELPFANAGAPCLGCHGISGFGLASGANFGPDLTSIHENFGDEGLVDILKTLPFPSMEPIYRTRPLTESEQADLRAFFAGAKDAPVANDGLLLIEMLSGMVIFIVIISLLSRERLRGVRKTLIKNAQDKKEAAR